MSRFSKSNPRRFFAFATVAAVVLALAQWGWAHRRARSVGPAAGACWIWSADVPTVAIDAFAAPAVALHAFSDVDLETVPSTVHAVVTADESYLLYINGAWVGGGQYRAGAGLDAFDVTPWLIAGRNRVLIEARSSRGVGGILAALIDAETGAPLLVTDGDWRVAEAHDPAHFRPESMPARGQAAGVPRPDTAAGPVVSADSVNAAPVASAAPVARAAQVWGVPPSGRWRVARTPESRDVWFRAGRRPEVVKPRRAIRLEPGNRWQRLRPHRIELPTSVTGTRTLFDFGRVIEAVPVVDLVGSDRRPGLLGIGETRAEFEVPAVDRHYVLISPVADAPFWAASAPIRFRYLEVFGTTLARRPFALLAPGVPVHSKEDVTRPVDGVFGLEPLHAPPRAVRAIIRRVALEALLR